MVASSVAIEAAFPFDKSMRPYEVESSYHMSSFL